jgi:hypothetical protein
MIGLRTVRTKHRGFARMREERKRKGAKRELEKEMKEVERELTTRPRERPDVEPSRKVQDG